MFSSRFSAVVIVAILVLGCVTVMPQAEAQTSRTSLTSSWLRNPVTLDGGITNPSEWSDASPTDLTFIRWHIGPENVSARVWLKNDATWLYVLERVKSGGGVPHSSDDWDSGYLDYFWPSWHGHWDYSDFGGVNFDNTTMDFYGWNGTAWQDDVSAGGLNNTQGRASYDGQYYWFEFKKPLDSADGWDPNTGWGLDWSFVAGGTYGTNPPDLLLGFWDNSTQTAYETYVLLHLSSPEMPVNCYSLVDPVTVDGKWTSAMEWSDAVEVPMYAAAGNADGYFRVKHDTSYLYVLVESLADYAVEYNTTQGFGDWMQVFFDISHNHGLPSTDDYLFSASYANPTLTRVREWEGNGTDWNDVPSVLSGVQAKIGLDSGYSPHAPHPHVVGEFKIPLSVGFSLGSEFGFYTHLGDSSEALTTVFYWPGPSSAPQRIDPGSWGDVQLSYAELRPMIPSSNLLKVPYHIQEGEIWCGPASVQMALEYISGDRVRQDVLAREMDTGPDCGGTCTENMSIPFHNRSWSLVDETHATLDELKELNSFGYVSIINIHSDTNHQSGHYVVVVGYNMTGITVNDPAGDGQTIDGRSTGPNAFISNQLLADLWSRHDQWTLEIPYLSLPITLHSGWNLFSLPLVPRNTAVATILRNQISRNEVGVVWSYTGSPRGWKSFTPGKASTLTTMVDGDAYWIYMQNNDTLYVNGYVIAPAQTPPSYSLVAGWNLVGFKPQPDVANETVGVYLQNIAGKYDPNNVWILDNTSGNWIRATGSTWLRPGEAMWVYMTASATLRP